MHDPLRVRRIQAVGNLNGEIEQRVNGQGRATCPLTRPDIVGTPSPRGLIVTHIFGWTPGVSAQYERGVSTSW